MNAFHKLTLAAFTASAMSLSMVPAVYADTAGDKVDRAEEAVSDTWITSKVKSTFLADGDISGLDIKVETNQGVVSLSGVVPTDAERELAIEKAKTIKGVRDVSADGLKSAE